LLLLDHLGLLRRGNLARVILRQRSVGNRLGGKTGTGGTAENPAGVPAKPVPDAALPQNHTGKITAAQQAKMIKQQQDLMRKKQAQREKAAKQAEEERAKKNKKKKVTTAPPSPQPPPQPQPADAGGSTIKQ
jgi:hypothetical protein